MTQSHISTLEKQTHSSGMSVYTGIKDVTPLQSDCRRDELIGFRFFSSGYCVLFVGCRFCL